MRPLPTHRRPDHPRPLGPRTLAVLTSTLCAALPALAQTTPADVQDLVGARGAGGEAQLTARGYVNVGGSEGSDRKWTYWWNESRGVCLSVATSEGRYQSIVATPAADCRRSGDRSATAPDFDSGGRRARDGYREHIALICYGEGHRQGSQLKSGYEWNSDKHRYVARSGVEITRQDYDTSVTIEINGTEGRIRPAKSMLPALHGDSDAGWYEISGLSISRDEIRGHFRLNALNKPKMTIDRRTGHINLEGMTNFNGSCDSLDQDRKF